MAHTVDKILTVAKGEVGYLEKKSKKNLNSKTKNAGSNNYTKYGAYFGINGPDAYWCDMFVDWCVVQAYGRDVAKKLLHGFSAYTPTSAQKFKDNDQWHKTPRIGDQIFFKNSQRICHTGIVYAVTDEMVFTIEATHLMEQPLYQTVVLYARNPTQRATAVLQDMEDLNMIT